MRQEIRAKNLTWIDIKGPEDDDIAYLQQNFKLHPLVLKEIMPPLDYPKIENFGDYLFVVFFHPFYDQRTIRTVPFELDVIVGRDYLITNHYKDIVPLKALFDQCNLYEDVREQYTDEGPMELLYRIINEILQGSFPKLGHIKEKIDEVEEAMYEKDYQETVKNISLIKRDIIGFQRIVEPQGLVLKNLAAEAAKFFGGKALPYFHNLVSVNDRVNNILSAHRKTLKALDSTSQSLLTNRTNDIIRVLTMLSALVLPLTLLAGIFSMNTRNLPITGSRYDFWIVTGIMLAGVLLMLAIFKKKKWI